MGSGLSILTSLSVDDLPQVDPVQCKHKFCERWGPKYFHCCDCHTTITDEELIQTEERILEGITDHSVPEDGVNRGVTIQFLCDFANACNCWDMNTRDVRRQFVMPATRATRCRFVELPEMAGVVGKSTTFVSHTWGAKFGDLVAALCDGNADRNRLVWVDIFAVRQWPSHKPDLDFSAVVRQCKSFLIVCSSLEEVADLSYTDRFSQNVSSPMFVRSQIAFLRVWCLVEVHAAVLSGVAIVMKGGSFVRNDEGILFQTNNRMLETLCVCINIESADATVAADKERILGEINATEGGVMALNAAVRGVMIGSYEYRNSIVECAACGDSNAVITVMEKSSKYIKSVAGCGFVGLLKELIDAGAKIDDGTKVKAFLAAAKGGHTGCVELLIKSGVDVKQNVDGRTALMYAAEGGHTKCAELLINNGSEVTARTSEDKTALMYAAEGGHTSCVELLINSGSEVTAVDCQDKSALMCAVEFGHVLCVEQLIKSGADVTAKDSLGWTALIIAAMNGQSSCVELLIKSGGDAREATADGTTALMFAAQGGHSASLELLLKNGCSTETVTSDGWTALMHAALGGNTLCIELLIKNGGNVLSANSEGMTALMFAAQRGHTACVDFLLKSGSDIEAVTSSSMTALMFAENREHSACVELLTAAANRGDAKEEQLRTTEGP